MFTVESKAARQRWIENYGEEDGSFTGNLETGKVSSSFCGYEHGEQVTLVTDFSSALRRLVELGADMKQ